MSNIDRSGTFPLGERTVKRLGYGVMQLAGPGVFVVRPRITPRRWPCFARPSRAG